MKTFSKVHITINANGLIRFGTYNWRLNPAAYRTNNWERCSQDFLMWSISGVQYLGFMLNSTIVLLIKVYLKNMHHLLFCKAQLIFLFLCTFSLHSLSVGVVLSCIPQHWQTICWVIVKYLHLLQYFPPAV